jgi:hypothetical protein
MARTQFMAGRWLWDGSDQLPLSADVIGTFEREIPPHNQKLCRLFTRNHNVLYSMTLGVKGEMCPHLTLRTFGWKAECPQSANCMSFNL